jgi:hypothetical protein
MVVGVQEEAGEDPADRADMAAVPPVHAPGMVPDAPGLEVDRVERRSCFLPR